MWWIAHDLKRTFIVEAELGRALSRAGIDVR